MLLGTVDIAAEPADLEADFRSLIEAAMGRGAGNVALRLWTPQGASAAFVKQVSPTIEDLTSRAAPVDTLSAEYPTGAWGDESRDYHLCINVQPRQLGEEMLAGRVSLVVGEEVVSQALIRAIWTDDEQLSTHINREVAHYTGQAELAEVIQEGREARKAGDEETATVKFGRAVQLAAASGHKATIKLLSASSTSRTRSQEPSYSSPMSMTLTRWPSTPAPRRLSAYRSPSHEHATCPNGHLSTTTDYCDQCGAPLASQSPPQSPTRRRSEVRALLPTPSQASPLSPAPTVMRPASAATNSARAADITSPAASLAPRRPPSSPLAGSCVRTLGGSRQRRPGVLQADRG